jgi:hypothetical protein
MVWDLVKQRNYFAFISASESDSSNDRGSYEGIGTRPSVSNVMTTQENVTCGGLWTNE